MGLFDKLFSRKPDDFLDKGNKQLAAGNFYEARCCYEDGKRACGNDVQHDNLVQAFDLKIAEANHGLAILNIGEAEHAKAAGNLQKAKEHCELAKTLTSDPSVREKADLLAVTFDKKINDTKALETQSSCSSCSSCSTDNHSTSASSVVDDSDLDPRVLYELLIHQLPEEMFQIYSSLGEDFAYMFIAASRDQHEYALELLEKWHVPGNNDDIYWNEKGKIVHRLGNGAEAEVCFLNSLKANSNNHLPYLGLALLLFEEQRFPELKNLLEDMISSDIFAGQSIMMMGEMFQITGQVEKALETFAQLLKTGLAKAAAEKIFEILQQQNRYDEASAVRKKYLSSCSH